MERRKAQTVDTQLHDDELPVDRQAGRLDIQNELKDRWDKLGILQTQQPQRREQDGGDGDQVTCDTDIGACDGRKIVVVGFFEDVKDRGRDQQRGGGVVNEDDDIALETDRSRDVGAFGIFDLGKGIEPLLLIERFDQALLIHAQIGDVEVFDTVGDIVQERVVDLVVHITDDDVALALASDGHRLGDEVRGADAAADQGGVEDDCLDKAVLTAAQHLVVLGL